MHLRIKAQAGYGSMDLVSRLDSTLNVCVLYRIDRSPAVSKSLWKYRDVLKSDWSRLAVACPAPLCLVNLSQNVL